MEGNFTREVAKRVFAAELKESNLIIKEGEGTYAINYLITPTGAKVNRIFLVGVLTEKEDKGTDTEYWQGRIVDPTGAFYVTAGIYQPEAAQVLAKLNVPEYVAVVGKISTYEPEEGKVLVSVKAESITVVDQVTRDKWIAETARLTEQRLNNISEQAKEHYNTDVQIYKDMIALAVKGGD
jgi:RPA family protein